MSEVSTERARKLLHYANTAESTADSQSMAHMAIAEAMIEIAESMGRVEDQLYATHDMLRQIRGG